MYTLLDTYGRSVSCTGVTHGEGVRVRGDEALLFVVCRDDGSVSCTKGTHRGVRVCEVR